MNENRIIFFSGGKASFKTAHYVKEKYPNDNILLLFTDTNFEDEDLYRFINEASDKLKLPMLTLNVGKNPKQLMEDDNFLYNSRVANCSIKLKVKPARDFIKKGIITDIHTWRNKQYLKTEIDTTNAILYFGIGYKEAHRTKAITKNWKPYRTEYPLIDNVDYDNDAIISDYGIKMPRLYSMGFAHNNCKGRCIKGGQGHWLTLYKKDRDSFNEMRDFEINMNKQLNKHHNTNTVYSFMKKKGEPYMLKDLEKEHENEPEQIDIFDFGTCGCFVDDE